MTRYTPTDAQGVDSMTKHRPVNSRIPEDDSIMEEMRLRCKRRGEELRALKEQVLANAIEEYVSRLHDLDEQIGALQDKRREVMAEAAKRGKPLARQDLE